MSLAREIWRLTLKELSRPAWSSDTLLMDSSGRRRLAEGRLVPRSEAWTQAVTERAVDLVVSALDVNALLDQVDLNAVLDEVDIDQLLERIDLDRLLARMDLNAVLQRIDIEALVEQTDIGSVIADPQRGRGRGARRGPQPGRRARRDYRPLDRAASPPPVYRPAWPA